MTVRLLTITVIAFCISANALANDYKAGSIEISSPWSRATPKGAQTAIGYMTIKNSGTTPDRIVGGSIDSTAGLLARWRVRSVLGVRLLEKKVPLVPLRIF
jgi:copper(I)-binding protein